jgi:hypothetical protein
MSRKFADDVELPNRDPASGNYAARKTYVDTKVADAANITTGRLDPARMPAILSPVRVLSISGGVLAIDASVVGNNVDVTVGANFTQNVPTNGTPGQVIQVTCFAGSAYTVTFNASFWRITTVAATLDIPAGDIARYTLRCTAASGSTIWIVEAAGTAT